MTLQVWFARLHAAADVWDDGHERLRGAVTSLSDAPLHTLGSRVAPHAKVFVDAWVAELRRLAAASEDHATGLRDTATILGSADRLSVEESQQLLPWLERDSTPSAPRGVR